MKSEAQILSAHQMLTQLMRGEIPEVTLAGIEADDLLLPICDDLLCWALGLGANNCFEYNLQGLRGKIKAAGYVLVELEQA